MGGSCDSTLFDIFTFQFLKGDPKTALRDSFSVVLTESTARTLFGAEDAFGKTIEKEVMPPSTSTYKVTGIVKDLPKSHLPFDYIFSIISHGEHRGSNFKPGVTDALNTYTHNFNIVTYLLLPHAHDVNATEDKLNAFFKEQLKDSTNLYQVTTLNFRPLKDVYFAQPLLNERDYCQHGNLGLIKILMAIAISVIIVASINYQCNHGPGIIKSC
jgi:putative ABC transport system permease protein